MRSQNGLAIWKSEMKIPAYYEMTILLSDGQIIKFKCKEYEFKFNSSTTEYTSYSFKGLKNGFKFGFNLNKMLGYTAKWKYGFM